MTDKEEAVRLIRDFYQNDDDIEHYSNIIRTGAFDEDNPNEEVLESLINTLQNENSYLQSCWDSDYADKFDWDELTITDV